MRIEHGALENKEILVSWGAQSKKKPFKRLSGKHMLEIDPLLPSQIL